MEEEYSRRKQQRPVPPSKFPVFFVILLLILNTGALGFLLFWNIQTNAKHGEQLESIEKQVSLIEQGAIKQEPVPNNTEQNVPVKDSSPHSGQTQRPSSVTESSDQTDQTTLSSESTPYQEERQSETGTSTTQQATSYTVQAGDTLSGIAEKNKLSLQELMTKNNLSDSTVYIGQVLSLQ